MIEKKVRVYITKLEGQVTDNRKKTESSIGKKLLYHGLQELSGYSWNDQKMALMTGGKPFFTEHQNTHFNISHSHDYVVCAIASRPLGIDIQYHKDVNIMRMAERILSPQEYHNFLRAEDQEKFFFQCWVEKESFLKWTGDGLRLDLRNLDLMGCCQHISIAENYSCALWSEQRLEIEKKEVLYQSLRQDEGS